MMIKRSIIFYFFLLIIILSNTASKCTSSKPLSNVIKSEVKENADAGHIIQVGYNEPYRPQYHYSPKEGAMLQPDVALYYRGQYHVYYRYADSIGVKPFGWGHAVSDNLVNWEEQPGISFAAIDSGFTSGTFIVGNGHTPLPASDEKGRNLIFIYFTNSKDKQYLNIAYSTDRGQRFTRLDSNPAHELEHNGLQDPKVFWHKGTERWILTAVQPARKQVVFYASPDLLSWEFMSEFGPAGDISADWRSPDLYKLPVEGRKDAHKWVLQLMTGNKPQYFVGNFDGMEFKNENTADVTLYVDKGPDYAGCTVVGNMPVGDNRVINIAWVGNSRYMDKVPTKPWKGAVALPRAVELRNFAEGIRLTQKPVEELKDLRGRRIGANLLSAKELNEFMEGRKANGAAMEIEVEVDVKDAEELGFKVLKGLNSEVIVGYNVKEEVLFIDRSKAVKSNLDKSSPADVYTANLPLEEGKLKLKILIDHSTIEVFANDGIKALTCQVYPDVESNKIEMYSEGGDARIFAVSVWQLNSIYQPQITLLSRVLGGKFLDGKFQLSFLKAFTGQSFKQKA
jgi:fructan beta-fructosidase